MAKNNDISQLDHFVALKRAVEASNDALRVKMIDGVEMSMELSAADGDSVMSLPELATHSANVSAGQSGDVLAAVDASGAREVQLYVESKSNIGGAITCKIMVSPLESGDVWLLVDSAIPGNNSGDVTATAVNKVVAKRIKVVMDSGIGSGTIAVHLAVRS